MLKTPGANRIPIIVGDWNEECKTSSSSHKLCSEFNLVDTWRVHHKNTEFNTHINGSRRIDFALAPPDLAPHMSIIYEPFHHRITVNHRGIFVDTPIHILFWNQTPPIFDAKTRGISSKDQKNVTKYIRAAYNHLKCNTDFSRTSNLLSLEHQNRTLAKTLDQELTRAGIHAENRCKRRRRDYWNIPTDILKAKLNVWRCT